MSSGEMKEMTADEILRKYDQESDKRELTGIWDFIVKAICIAFAAFQIYTATFGILDAHLQRSIHLAFGFILIFLLYPTCRSWSRTSMNWFDVLLGIAGVVCALYIVVFY